MLRARALGKIALQEKRGQVHGDLLHLPGGPKFFRQTCTYYTASEDHKESRRGWGGWVPHHTAQQDPLLTPPHETSVLIYGSSTASGTYFAYSEYVIKIDCFLFLVLWPFHHLMMA